MTVLIDDHVLGRALTETLTETDLDAIDEDIIATTGCWYYRLCHAVRSPRITGALSAPFVALPPELRERSIAALLYLPPEIVLMNLRDIAPTMAVLVDRHPLNLLSLEALSAATAIKAAVVLDRANTGGPLNAALTAEGFDVRIV